ncbi:MAG: hypothetical protein F4213_13100 [Boseongicola sp. SB0677_bin_26]|nr:hypothetical protein [Boseongicola sp. SB0665_bin_10]MYG26937.1 hypothetical protein [Boseongicola sp. SB0677_bin_26]
MRAIILAAAMLIASVVLAEKVRTPEAAAFNITVRDDTNLVYGMHLYLGNESAKIGMYAVCHHGKRTLEVTMVFGAFPADIPVQAAIRTADGDGWHGGPRLAGSPMSGFHEPRFTGGEAFEVIDHAFRKDSLISNGWNSFWNRIPQEVNARVRDDLANCVAGRH